MNPMTFLNQMFQMAALNEYAKMLDDTYGDQGGCFCDLDDKDAKIAAFKAAQEAGEEPLYICSQDHGHFVTHTFGSDGDTMRMVCWAEMGPQAFNKLACEWWKAQGADPDSIVPGVTDLHSREPEPQPVKKPSRDTAIEFIGALAELNPSRDPHGSMDEVFTQACADYDPDYQTETPLTLEEWKELTRGGEGGFDKPFARNIKDATNPFVFLAVLRDRLVFASGSTDSVVRMIGVIVDPHIDARTMTWRP